MPLTTGTAELAAQQAALRRVAALVAAGAASVEVFAAIAREVAQVVRAQQVQIWRWERDGTPTVAGSWGREPSPPGSVATAPIVVDGESWGLIGVGMEAGVRLPDRVEAELAEFTALIATAISNSARREQLARLADEQAALRRVATLVAHRSPPADVFAAVAEELGRLLAVTATGLVRYEPGDTATVLAGWGLLGEVVPLGARLPVTGENVIARIARTGRPARLDDLGRANGRIGDHARRLAIRSAVGAPIVVAGQLWGAMIASSRRTEPIPAGTEGRIQDFTELVGAAIANAEAREALAASRARIVSAADEERRRVVRDLHDGAQQRLVHTVITLKLARKALEHGPAAGRALVADALHQAERATEELRELAQGILPAVLVRGGLVAGADVLASRSTVPVETDVRVGRLSTPVEATAYFLMAEALANVAKHAGATRATLAARVDDGVLHVEVRDDGIGDGNGLVGVADRLAALDASLSVESPAGGGTVVTSHIPLSVASVPG